MQIQSSSAAQSGSFLDCPGVPERKTWTVTCTWHYHQLQQTWPVWNLYQVLLCSAGGSAQMSSLELSRVWSQHHWEGFSWAGRARKAPRSTKICSDLSSAWTWTAQQWPGAASSVQSWAEELFAYQRKKSGIKKCYLLRERTACWGCAVATKCPTVLVWGCLPLQAVSSRMLANISCLTNYWGVEWLN